MSDPTGDPAANSIEPELDGTCDLDDDEDAAIREAIRRVKAAQPVEKYWLVREPVMGNPVTGSTGNPADLDALRVRVAELCGWTQKQIATNSPLFWHSPDGVPRNKYMMPNFATSLDAMALAEATLNVEQMLEYNRLLEIAKETRSALPIGYPARYRVWHTDAETRARAFCKVMEGR